MNESRVEIRNCTWQEISDFFSICDQSIYHAFRLPESGKDKLIHPDRQIIALDRHEIVGTSGSYQFCLTVPGGNIAAAGVTFVGVLQTHRRQGILNRMMCHQINDLYKKGDCIAMLWSSEGDFYRRYGYGVASRSIRLQAEKDRSQIAREPKRDSRLSFIDPNNAIATLAPIYDAICKKTPGMIRRSQVWWDQLLSNSTVNTHPPVQVLSVRQDGSSHCSGYAIYRTLLTWDGRPAGAALNIVEAMGLSPKDNEDLWRFFTNMDLVKEIKADCLPIDHPIFLLAREPARLHQEIQDGLWLRLIDMRSALKRRQYSRVGTIIFEVTDQLCPWNAGRWKLEWNGETVSCEKTGLDAHISLDVSGLASAYLGGITFSELQSSGWLSEQQDEAVIRADELFHWSPAPWCPDHF